MFKPKLYNLVLLLLKALKSSGCSSFGFDSCNPTCLAIQTRPLGDFKKLPTRAVSLSDAKPAFTTPPLIRPSSNEVNLSLGCSGF